MQRCRLQAVDTVHLGVDVLHFAKKYDHKYIVDVPVNSQSIFLAILYTSSKLQVNPYSLVR